MIYINQKYTVKKGDTLYGISNQFGVSVTELAELNGIKGSNLQIGEELLIPTKSGTNPNNMFMYTVKSGDTLYGIARKYNTTVDEIMKINYFTSANLIPGQVIRIPEMYTKEEDMYMPNFVNYTVKKGDTLYSIARNNNVAVDTLIKDNGLTSNTLSIGQTIRIRTPQIIVEEECFGPSYTPPSNNTYIVKKGDNLYSIARNFNTTVQSIKNKNNLKSNTLSIGQKLII